MTANPRRLTNEELAARGARRAALRADAVPDAEITEEDLELMPPSQVVTYMNAGRLVEKFKVPPQRVHGRPR